MIPSQNQLEYPLFKTIFHSKPILHCCIAIPCIILWITISFIYFSYIFFYVIPLINDTYWYDNNPNSQLTENQFPIFKHIMNLDTRLFLKDSNEPQNHIKKGYILFIIFHYILFWLLLSLIRTMFTDPGGTPDSNSPWAMKIENIANEYLEKARKILRKFKKNELKQMITSTILDSNLLNRPKTCLTEILDPQDIRSITEEAKEDIEKDKQLIYSESSHKNGSHHEISEVYLSEDFTEQENEEINKLALEMVMSKEIFRYCGFCRTFKPLRTHHCRQCMRCVLKMDHHCQWVLNCVGLKNYKYFMNMLIYGGLSLLFILITFTRCIMDVALNPYVNGIIIYFILVAYVLTVVLFGVVFIFTCFHFWLILKGKSTIEYCEKGKKNDKDPQKLKKKKRPIIVYNEGTYKNFTDVFNGNPIFWFFPVFRNEKCDGLFEEYEDKFLK